MFRLLGLLGGLSLVTDVGTGAPLEESLKRCVVATRLARAVGCSPAQTSELLYTSLLQHLGCTAYAHEGADVWGDDLAVVRLAFLTNFSDRKDVWRTWVPGLADATGTSRARVVATALTAGRKGELAGPAATCEVARDASRWLGLPESVQDDLFHALTMWNGRGHPAVAGDDIPLVTRLMHVAATAALFTLHAGQAEAVAQVRRRSGTYLDPELAEVFVDRADELAGDLDELDGYEEALASEPHPVLMVDEDRVEAVAQTFGSLADLKSPWLQGHSAAVAELAASAVAGLGMADQVRTVRVAGHLHDVGRVGVSSRIWDKAGPLSTTERDQARLHPYYSERILARTPALADVAKLAGQHHERCDGSGYHRGRRSDQLSMAARVLAAADDYRTSVEPRRNRPGLPAAQAAGRLESEVRAGRLDPDAVAAVLAAAGCGGPRRRAGAAGLTPRQVEVLRLVSRGLSNREVARRLGVSPRTVDRHVADLYERIGTSSRAAAALFAMEHGLVGPSGSDGPG
jgi:HD-GYP domain-containing protein (c-di-GMP phosphodiesterase class II)/DNA-binding CsgD family transcriptional regulator